tara:strand:- start:468 stop:659 length:192 start_codon:yes stop_codon:yes gene_type:complete
VSDTVLQSLAAELDEIQAERRCSFDDAVKVLIDEETDSTVKANTWIASAMIESLRDVFGPDAI